MRSATSLVSPSEWNRRMALAGTSGMRQSRNRAIGCNIHCKSTVAASWQSLHNSGMTRKNVLISSVGIAGAEGLHSAVRCLAFGPEHRFARLPGMYVGTMQTSVRGDTRELLLCNRPGISLSIHPGKGKPARRVHPLLRKPARSAAVNS